MTYNFDPDRWYENHRAAIQNQLDREEIDGETARERFADLDRRYDEIVARLDGTYVLPTAASRDPSRVE